MSKQIFIGILIIISTIYTQTKLDSLINLLPIKTGAEKVDILNQLSNLNEGDLQAALDYSRDAKTLAENIKYTKGVAQSYLNSGLAYFTAGEYEKAQESYFTAQRLFEQTQDNLSVAETFNKIGICYEKMLKFEDAKKYYKKSLNLTRTLDPTIFEYEPANNLGLHYWRVSQYDSAIIYYEIAKNITETFKDSARIGRILNNIGIIYWQWNLYDKALDNYVQSLNIRKSLKDTIGICKLLNNIGVTYVETKNMVKARQYFEEALDYARKIDNHEQIGYGLLNVAHSYLQEGNLDKAERNYKMSNSEYYKAGIITGKLLTFIQIGKIRNMQNDPDSALAYLNDAVKIAEELNNIKRQAMALQEIGNSYFLKGDFTRAEKNYKDALELSTGIDKLDVTTEIYQKLAELYEMKGNLKASLENYKLYYQSKDSLDNVDIKRRILEYQTRYETEKSKRDLEEKEYEIARSNDILLYGTIALILLLIVTFVLYYINYGRKKALQKLNLSYQTISNQKDEISEQKQILETKNLELENAFSRLTKQKNELDFVNAAKDKLFSVLAHDIKNPLGAITSYTTMLKDEREDMAREEYDEITGNLYSCSTQLEELLGKIITWSKNQQGLISVKKLPLNIDEVTKSAIAPLTDWMKNKNISLELNLDGHSVFADRFMLETIVRNLVHNSVKFTEPGGKISINSSSNRDNTIIEINDTGIGLGKEKLDQLFSDEIAESDTGSGLGFRIIKEFMMKQGASINAFSELGKGTTFSLVFPNQKEED